MKKTLHTLALISILLLSFPVAIYAQTPTCYSESDDGDGVKTPVPCGPGAQVDSTNAKAAATKNNQPAYGEVAPGAATDKFVPLTSIPNLTQGVSNPDLSVFLNNLYRICIGIAVVLAVLQLIRAGITYSMSDAITSKEEAKHLMLASILGLVLVLSPAIVFGIINPRILDLEINVSGLKLEQQTTDTTKKNNVTGTAQEDSAINSCTQGRPECSVQRTRYGRGDVSECVCSTQNTSSADAAACSTRGTGGTTCSVVVEGRSSSCVCKTTLTPSTASESPKEGVSTPPDDPKAKCAAEGGSWVVSRVGTASCVK